MECEKRAQRGGVVMFRQHGHRRPCTETSAELSVELTQLKQTEVWLYDFDSQMVVRHERKGPRSPNVCKLLDR